MRSFWRVMLFLTLSKSSWVGNERKWSSVVQQSRRRWCCLNGMHHITDLTYCLGIASSQGSIGQVPGDLFGSNLLPSGDYIKNCGKKRHEMVNIASYINLLVCDKALFLLLKCKTSSLCAMYVHFMCTFNLYSLSKNSLYLPFICTLYISALNCCLRT